MPVATPLQMEGHKRGVVRGGSGGTRGGSRSSSTWVYKSGGSSGKVGLGRLGGFEGTKEGVLGAQRGGLFRWGEVWRGNGSSLAWLYGNLGSINEQVQTGKWAPTRAYHN